MLLEQYSPAGARAARRISGFLEGARRGSRWQHSTAIPLEAVDDEADNDQSSDEFEFAFVAENLSDSSLADKVFKDGWLYPLFDRSLLGDTTVASEKYVDLQKFMLDKQEVCPRSDFASSSSTMNDLDATAWEVTVRGRRSQYRRRRIDVRRVARRGRHFLDGGGYGILWSAGATTMRNDDELLKLLQRKSSLSW